MQFMYNEYGRGEGVGGGSGLGRVATLHSAALERMHCAWQMLAIHFLSHKIEKLFSLIFAEFFVLLFFLLHLLLLLLLIRFLVA